MNAFLKKTNLRLPLPNSSNRSSMQLGKKLALVIIFLIAFIGLLNIFRLPIKNTFYTIASPMLKTSNGAGNNTFGFLTSFLNAKGLLQENNNLKEENQHLLAQISSLQETIKGDQAIREIITNTQEDNFTMALVGTIGLDAQNDILLIDKGSNDGISENMPVISSNKVLFGKTIKVYENFSQVMLISKKNNVVDVKIQTNDAILPPILGAIKGNGNLSMYLDLVSSNTEINQEQILLTSGLEGVFPKNLLIGKITSIDKNDSKPFQTAQIQPFFDLKNTNNLFVITNYLKK